MPLYEILDKTLPLKLESYPAATVYLVQFTLEAIKNGEVSETPVTTALSHLWHSSTLHGLELAASFHPVTSIPHYHIYTLL